MRHPNTLPDQESRPPRTFARQSGLWAKTPRMPAPRAAGVLWGERLRIARQKPLLPHETQVKTRQVDAIAPVRLWGGGAVALVAKAALRACSAARAPTARAAFTRRLWRVTGFWFGEVSQPVHVRGLWTRAFWARPGAVRAARPAAGRQMRPRSSLRPPTAAARQGTRRRLAIVPGRRLPRRLARALSAGRRAPPRGLVPAGFPCPWDWGGCRLGGTGAPWEARGAPMPQDLPICASRAHACPRAPAGGRLEGQCI